MVKAKTVGYFSSNLVTNVLLPDLKREQEHFGCIPHIIIVTLYPLGPDMTIVRGGVDLAKAIKGGVSDISSTTDEEHFR